MLGKKRVTISWTRNVPGRRTNTWRSGQWHCSTLYR